MSNTINNCLSTVTNFIYIKCKSTFRLVTIIIILRKLEQKNRPTDLMFKKCYESIAANFCGHRNESYFLFEWLTRYELIKKRLLFVILITLRHVTWRSSMLIFLQNNFPFLRIEINQFLCKQTSTIFSSRATFIPSTPPITMH
jgi:hypothetical protein